jgi:uncharacterized membrane protein YeaQ/YmgE (transglycosylase-associated protein family)
MRRFGIEVIPEESDDSPNRSKFGKLRFRSKIMFGTFAEARRFVDEPRPAHHLRRDEMGLLILLVVGGIIGWLASMIMRTDAQQGIVLNVVVGIIGSLLAAFLLSPLLGVAPITSGAITASTLIVSLLGAIVLLAIVNLVRRGTVR